MPRTSLPTHFKEMRTYPVQLTKTTEEDLKSHMKSMCESYQAKVQPELNEQSRILNLLTHENNPYKNHKWRKGHPERRFKSGFDQNNITEEKADQLYASLNVERDFRMCLREFKWTDDWVVEFNRRVDDTRDRIRRNIAEIKDLDELMFYCAKKQWEDSDAEWIAREKMRKSHVHHKPKSYYIQLFKIDKDAERYHQGVIPDNEDTCEFCIQEKKVNEAREEAMRKEEEEYERQCEELREEERRREEERKKQEKPVELKEHTCEYCNFKTMYEAVFRAHTMTQDHERIVKQKQLYCKHCDHQCRNNIEYENHIRTNKHKKNAGLVSTEPSVFECEACGYSSVFKHHYENHIKSKKHQQKMSQEVVVPTTA